MGDLEKVDIAYLRYDALQRLAFGIACEQPTRLGIAVTVRVELEQPDEAILVLALSAVLWRNDVEGKPSSP